jgi:hypothetical protein
VWKQKIADEEKKATELRVEYEEAKLSAASESERVLSENSKRYETGGTAPQK